MSNKIKKKQQFIPNLAGNNHKGKHLIRILKTKPDKKSSDLSIVEKEFVIPIEEFLTELKKIKKIVMLLYNFTAKSIKETDGNLRHIIDSNKIKETNDYTEIGIAKEQYKIFRLNLRDHGLLIKAPSMILENFLISIFSQYENFLTNQIKLVFQKYPEKLGDDKKLNYSDFVKFISLDDIRNFYIENEVRGIISQKTYDQIKTIESKILDYKNIKILQNNLPLESLVELSSRRNLYVHNEGKIHEQYINNCKEVSLCINEQIGEKLDIDNNYFDRAFETIFEATLMISYLVGKKVFSQNEEELKFIDPYFNGNCLDLIDPESPESIDFPIRLLEFVLKKENKIEHKAIDTFLFSINLALCYKIKGDESKMNEILNGQDLSACDKSIEFAYHILKKDYNNAVKLMSFVSVTKEQRKDAKESGVKIIFDEEAYHEFPMFYEIKKEEIFLQKYKEIFNKEYNDESYYF